MLWRLKRNLVDKFYFLGINVLITDFLSDPKHLCAKWNYSDMLKNVSLELFSIAECWGVKYCPICRTSSFVAPFKECASVLTPMCYFSHSLLSPFSSFHTLEKLRYYFLTVGCKDADPASTTGRGEVDRMRQSKLLTALLFCHRKSGV